MSKIKAIPPTKFLIETSLQIERVKKGGDYLRTTLGNNTECYSSYFVFYEYKRGLIKSFIDIYSLIEIEQNVSRAFNLWSDKFAPRELKNFIILQSIIAQKCDSIMTADTASALRQIESAIRRAVADFSVAINYLTGDFAGNELVKFPIRKASDFPEFLELCKNSKIIPLINFWEKHADELVQLTSLKKPYEKDVRWEKMYDNLEGIRAGTVSADKYHVNRSIGDAVISADTTKKFTLASLDTLFEVLCDLQNKPHQIVKKTHRNA